MKNTFDSIANAVGGVSVQSIHSIFKIYKTVEDIEKHVLGYAEEVRIEEGEDYA